MVAPASANAALAAPASSRNNALRARAAPAYLSRGMLCALTCGRALRGRSRNSGSRAARRMSSNSEIKVAKTSEAHRRRIRSNIMARALWQHAQHFCRIGMKISSKAIWHHRAVWHHLMASNMQAHKHKRSGAGVATKIAYASSISA